MVKFLLRASGPIGLPRTHRYFAVTKISWKKERARVSVKL